MTESFADDVAAVRNISGIERILEVACRLTGMRFAAVARVTESRWVACSVLDRLEFGLAPGGELPVETTLCSEVRGSCREIVIANVPADPAYRDHHTPRIYGLRSYIAVPIVLSDGGFFGTLCSIDPDPAPLDDPGIVEMFSLFAELIAFRLETDERWATADAIRRSDTLARSLLAASPDCIKLLSADGVIEFMNRRGVALNQLRSEADVLGRELASLWPEDGRECIRAAIRRAAAGETVRFEGFCPTATGEPRWWDVSFAPFRPSGGGEVKLVGISRDITAQVAADEQRRQNEQALQQLNEELEQRVVERTRALEASQEALRQSQKMEAIGQLTGGVAHDFNNLLTVIRSSADLLRQPNLSAERQRRYVDAIAETSARATKLTAQLLAFSRRQALKPEVFDVGERLDGVADMLRTVLGARIQLVIESGAVPCLVEADVGQFETALVNMVVNARDAMDGHGRLTLAVEPVDALPAIRGHAGAPGLFVAIRVTDTGIGITADDLPRIFEPFFTTKGIGKGTGLGLSQVFGFAKQSGGEIDVASTPGQGTTFILYLPRTNRTDLGASQASHPVTVAPGGRVLVVEDNVQVGEFVTQLLGDLGFEPTLAGNAKDALDRLAGADDRFDLLFSDIVMPGISGVELAREVARRWPALPVVLTSGYSHVLAAEASHGFTLLQKPYSIDDLSNVLHRAIAARR